MLSRVLILCAGESGGSVRDKRQEKRDGGSCLCRHAGADAGLPWLLDARLPGRSLVRTLLPAVTGWTVVSCSQGLSAAPRVAGRFWGEPHPGMACIYSCTGNLLRITSPAGERPREREARRGYGSF